MTVDILESINDLRMRRPIRVIVDHKCVRPHVFASRIISYFAYILRDTYFLASPPFSIAENSRKYFVQLKVVITHLIESDRLNLANCV